MRALIHCVLAIAAIPVLAAGPWASAEAAAVRGDMRLPKGAVMDHLRRVAAESIELAVSDHGPVALGAAPTRVRLSPPAAAGALAQRIKTLAPSDQIYLILQGINADVPPGITYNVFLGLPDAAASSGPEDPHYVGTLSFFDTGPSRSAVFNVTRKVRKLGDTGVLGDRPTITIIPAGIPEGGAKPTVDKMLLVAAGS